MTNLISVPDDLLRRAKEKALVKEEDWTQVVAEILPEKWRQVPKIGREIIISLIPYFANVYQAVKSNQLDKLISEMDERLIGLERNVWDILSLAESQLPAEIDWGKTDWGTISLILDNAQHDPDKHVKTTWARILAGEFENPGTYTRRSIRMVQEMSKDEVETIEKLRNLTWEFVSIEAHTFEERVLHKDPVVFAFDRKDRTRCLLLGEKFHSGANNIQERCKALGIDHGVLQNLSDAGIIDYTSIGQRDYLGSDGYFSCAIYGDRFIYFPPSVSFSVGGVHFANAGWPLLNLCKEFKPVEGVFEHMMHQWADVGGENYTGKDYLAK